MTVGIEDQKLESSYIARSTSSHTSIPHAPIALIISLIRELLLNDYRKDHLRCLLRPNQPTLGRLRFTVFRDMSLSPLETSLLINMCSIKRFPPESVLRRF